MFSSIANVEFTGAANQCTQTTGIVFGHVNTLIGAPRGSIVVKDHEAEQPYIMEIEVMHLGAVTFKLKSLNFAKPLWANEITKPTNSTESILSIAMENYLDIVQNYTNVVRSSACDWEIDEINTIRKSFHSAGAKALQKLLEMDSKLYLNPDPVLGLYPALFAISAFTQKADFS